MFASWHFWIGVSCCFRKAVYDMTFRAPSLKAHLLELIFAGGELWADPRLHFLSFLGPTLSLRPPGADLCHRPGVREHYHRPLNEQHKGTLSHSEPRRGLQGERCCCRVSSISTFSCRPDFGLHSAELQHGAAS